MVFKLTSVQGTGKEIVQEVIEANTSQLLIPPRFKNQKLVVPSLEPEGKHVGLFSSGTTGKPKCIWNSFERLRKNSLYTADAFGINPNHTLLILAAPWHVAGLSWAMMADELGCDYKLITTKKDDKETWLGAIKEVQPDYLLTVPAILKALYEKDWKVPNVVFGGYSIEQEDLNSIANHCEVMYQGYGQTEAGGLIAVHKRHSSDHPKKFEYMCCGQPIEGVTLYCEGTAEEPKEIHIESRTAFTQKRFNTRDKGFKDDIGRIYILGRADNVLNSKQ
jgi:O-succinylbenzoic acid--CoA ligase